ncbi:MAG: TerD family protein [Alphaproteobacteria bacterium]|nr:TerD family protein [Alphaproteobacteria bacterium]MCB9975232.1 TerD family protein [Rhodospirillales bacterium]
MVDIFDPNVDKEVKIELNQNALNRGDEINLNAKDPTLKSLQIGVGWDLNAFDTDPLDLDISCFMLNRQGKTRVNEDFIFYNNFEGTDKAVLHDGDNRTGAADGDDESMTVILNNIHFDIVQVMFVLSIYKGEEKGQSLSKVRNGYFRLVNRDTNIEIARYDLEKDVDERKETAMLVGVLNREGPKWHFVALGECVDGGLRTIAEGYDIIVSTS